ncbi:hybrid sensor histidine kinase/response regulator [Iningainema tapete]|uniref:histidine kinase n=1 Tax=Iningainema tapete BLCC-T55 TaxID=2748662 RepID=A0A8J6XE58_9CYAN|nr:response regulator [Iningainema tapete]MBD2774665.1 response regulator [Iningainema tapete BLCC-T55]
MKKILVIEDDKNVRQNLMELLTFENFHVIIAANGELGVQLAQTEIPDLIICDVMMPELDGHTVLKTLRQQSATAIIPFIFLTARSDKNGFRQGMELGADDYLTKPFTRAELLAAITSQLKKQVSIHQRSQKKLDDLRSTIAFSLPHEMRTPLNGILGFSELLSKDVDVLTTQEIREMAEGINKSGQRLYRLIQNFLLYAEIEIVATDTQRIKEWQSYQTIFPTGVLKNLIIDKAKKAGRETDLQINIDTPCLVQMCETRLYKIIEELIDNTLKFSPLGTSIQVESTAIKDKFILSFINYGRGITAHQIAELGAYKQFERKVYEQQGLGLGLIIAKRLTELHGGELKIQSQPQEKTIVQVVLKTA